MATCVLAGVEPWAYLADVLEKLASGCPQRRLEELLPPMWKVVRGCRADAFHLSCCDLSAAPPHREAGRRRTRYHICSASLHRSAEWIPPWWLPHCPEIRLPHTSGRHEPERR
ncbi:transposase domain-containing protein [Archangium minus]|uniref:transposase domain-containing protein n=1 Tax=Archangium minus TaxID=83450 RepID=UPI0037BF62B1